MKQYLPAIPIVPPILLVYPNVYERLTSGVKDENNVIGRLMAQCQELVLNRPTNPEDRRDGYHFKNSGGAFLFAVWSHKETEPDIFIISGPGNGFGPGHTCPTEDELQKGIYGDLVQVPLML